MDPITIAAVGGTVLGGAASYFGQRSANKTNLQIAREQMAFQERMSSTAHQREVEDLRKAGLNPLLSAGGSGSSTPSGASTHVDNTMKDFARSPEVLLAIQQGRANIGKTKAETAVYQATKTNLEEQNKNLQETNKNIAADTYVKQWNAAKIEAELSGTTVMEAGIKLFGQEFKFRSQSYNNQNMPLPAANANSDVYGVHSSQPWRSQIVGSVLSSRK